MYSSVSQYVRGISACSGLLVGARCLGGRFYSILFYSIWIFPKEMTTTMDHQQLKSCGLKEGPIYPAQWATLHTFRQVPSTQ